MIESIKSFRLFDQSLKLINQIDKFDLSNQSNQSDPINHNQSNQFDRSNHLQLFPTQSVIYPDAEEEHPTIHAKVYILKIPIFRFLFINFN